MPRPVSSRLPVFIAVALSAAIVGCGHMSKKAAVPTLIYTPTQADVIESITLIDNDTQEFRLASGGTYRYDRRTTPSKIEPTAHDLVLAGTHANGVAWAYVVRHDAGGGSCYRVRAPAFVRERRVLFATGLSLPMTPGFDTSSAGEDGVWANDQAGFLCLDRGRDPQLPVSGSGNVPTACCRRPCRRPSRRPCPRSCR
jgi:hypothetical protein